MVNVLASDLENLNLTRGLPLSIPFQPFGCRPSVIFLQRDVLIFANSPCEPRDRKVAHTQISKRIAVGVYDLV